VSTAFAVGPGRPTGGHLPWAAIPIIAGALLVGLALGDPAPLWWIPLGAAMVVGVLAMSMRWPYPSLLLLIGSSVLLVVVRVVGLRSANLIDVLLPPVLLVSVLGGARRAAHAESEAGPAHDRLHRAERGLFRWVLVFYGIAALSLVRLAQLAGVGPALESSLTLIRAFQGLSFYGLCIWWLRDPVRIERAWRAIFIAGSALVILNIVGVAAWGVKRAGMTFFLNNWDAPFADPNEAGTASLIVGTVLIIRHATRPQARNLVLGGLMVLMLGLTQSRSAILAWATFGLFTLRWIRPAKILAGAFGIAMILPLLPASFWIRMTRSLEVERGTFETYSILFRLYTWKSAWSVVQDHWLIGVGYLGFHHVSRAYNQFGVVLGSLENYYYEVLVSMGVIGLAVLGVVLVKLYRLGREVGRVAPAGSLAHHMARYHAPLITALLVANLTGDNFMGLVGLAQLSIWTAVLVRSGHAAVAADSRA
jgi:hypothetical protein